MCEVKICISISNNIENEIIFLSISSENIFRVK